MTGLRKLPDPAENRPADAGFPRSLDAGKRPPRHSYHGPRRRSSATAKATALQPAITLGNTQHTSLGVADFPNFPAWPAFNVR